MGVSRSSRTAGLVFAAAFVTLGAGVARTPPKSGVRSDASAGEIPPTASYEIYGVRFAGYHGFPVSDLVLGADTTRRTDLAFIVWVLKPAGSAAPATGSHVVLFDAGFYRDKFLAQWKPVDFVKPSAAIEKAGIHPEDVTNVIISHIHWDHVDGADLFPAPGYGFSVLNTNTTSAPMGNHSPAGSIRSTPRCSLACRGKDASA